MRCYIYRWKLSPRKPLSLCQFYSQVLCCESLEKRKTIRFEIKQINKHMNIRALIRRQRETKRKSNVKPKKKTKTSRCFRVLGLVRNRQTLVELRLLLLPLTSCLYNIKKQETTEEAIRVRQEILRKDVSLNQRSSIMRRKYD